MAKTYNVFISHSWAYVEDLKNLRTLLNNRGYFNVQFDTPHSSLGYRPPAREVINPMNTQVFGFDPLYFTTTYYRLILEVVQSMVVVSSGFSWFN